MKKIILLIALLITTLSFAQIGFNYKALIKDDLGNVVTNQEIDIKFSLEFNLGVEFGIISVYEELHTVTTTNNGIVILNIGEGTAISGTFPQNGWNSSTYVIIEIDLEQDGTFVNLGTTNFKMVPMALSARHAKFAITANTANNVTGLEQITESDGTQNNTGWRLVGVTPENYGSIGENAVDLSVNIYDFEEYGAIGYGSVAMGTSNIASGKYSTALGTGTTASGIYSTALGYGTRAESFRSIAIGSNNIGGGYAGVESNPNSTVSWVRTDPLFEIGNGRNGRSNALTVLKNGSIGIGNHQPKSLLEVAHFNSAPIPSNLSNALSVRNIGGDFTANTSDDESWQFYTQFNGNLHLYNNGTYRGAFLASSGAYLQTSDRKLKKDITPLENGTLNKVLQLNPVSYLIKKQTDTKRNLGLISQEVQEIFPSITRYVEESDLLTLSYTELIPVLIKALQEQQTIIENQNTKINNQALDKVEINKALQALINRVERIENKQSN